LPPKKLLSPFAKKNRAKGRVKAQKEEKQISVGPPAGKIATAHASLRKGEKDKPPS